MLKKLVAPVLLVIGGVLGMFVVSAALQPATFSISRSATMKAPPAKPFEQVNNFHNWEGWSPWAKLDPAAKNAFEGPTAGKGAKFSWAGNSQVGEGSMTITESKPTELVQLNLEFIKPFPGKCDVDFTFVPQGDQTEVTWTMHGENNFMGRLFCMFMNMDKMMGGEFDKGLASMKAIVEADPKSAGAPKTEAGK